MPIYSVNLRFYFKVKREHNKIFFKEKKAIAAALCILIADRNAQMNAKKKGGGHLLKYTKKMCLLQHFYLGLCSIQNMSIIKYSFDPNETFWVVKQALL